MLGGRFSAIRERASRAQEKLVELYNAAEEAAQNAAEEEAAEEQKARDRAAELLRGRLNQDDPGETEQDAGVERAEGNSLMNLISAVSKEEPVIPRDGSVGSEALDVISLQGTSGEEGVLHKRVQRLEAELRLKEEELKLSRRERRENNVSMLALNSSQSMEGSHGPGKSEEQISRMIARLEREVREKDEKLVFLESDRTETRNKMASLAVLIDSKSSEVNQLIHDRDDARSETERLRRDLEAARSEASAAHGAIASKDSIALQAAREQESILAQKVASLTQERDALLEKTVGREDQTNGHVPGAELEKVQNELHREIEKSRALANAKTDLTAFLQTARRDRDRLSRELEHSHAELEETNKSLHSLQIEVEQLRPQYASAERERLRLVTEVDRLNTRVEEVRQEVALEARAELEKEQALAKLANEEKDRLLMIGKSAEKERLRLSAELDKMHGEMEALRRRVASATGQSEMERSKAEAAAQEMAQLQGRVESGEKGRAKLLEDLDQLRGDLRTAKREGEIGAERVTRLEESKHVQEAEIDRMRQANDAAEKERLRLVAELSEMTGDKHVLELKVEGARQNDARHEQTREELEHQKSELQSQLEQAHQELKLLRVQMSEERATMETTVATLTETQRQLETELRLVRDPQRALAEDHCGNAGREVTRSISAQEEVVSELHRVKQDFEQLKERTDEERTGYDASIEKLVREQDRLLAEQDSAFQELNALRRRMLEEETRTGPQPGSVLAEDRERSLILRAEKAEERMRSLQEQVQRTTEELLSTKREAEVAKARYEGELLVASKDCAKATEAELRRVQEGQRKALTARKQAEEERAKAEEEVTQAKEQCLRAEKERAGAEAERIQADADRINAQKELIAAERARNEATEKLQQLQEKIASEKDDHESTDFKAEIRKLHADLHRAKNTLHMEQARAAELEASAAEARRELRDLQRASADVQAPTNSIYTNGRVSLSREQSWQTPSPGTTEPPPAPTVDASPQPRTLLRGLRSKLFSIVQDNPKAYRDEDFLVIDKVI